MIKKEFEINMERRFKCGEAIIQHWIQFAENNVSSKQYVNFTPEPDEQAIQRWLDSIYTSLYFAQREVGDKAVNDILQLTDKHCLYPYEIMGVIEHLKSGGDTSNLIEKSLNGILDGKFPPIDDVKKDLSERKKKNEIER